ncbi:hypothetical protein D9M72_511440 [compost metagenome]
MAGHLRVSEQPVHHGLVHRLCGDIEELGSAGYRQLRKPQPLDQCARLEAFAGVVLADELRRPVAEHQPLGEALLFGERHARDHEMAKTIAGDQSPHEMQKFVFGADGSRIDVRKNIRRFSLAQQGRFIRFLHLRSPHPQAPPRPVERIQKTPQIT